MDAAWELNEVLRPLRFSEPVSHVYLPTDYAWDRHCDYLRRYAGGKKRVLFLGMNPGPWGMSQTGVPFGEIPAVRDWLGIDGPVDKPEHEHPKRPVDGFDCTRSEVSGRRLWGLFAETYPSAEAFFAEHFVANYCPLVWMAETGRNITPDKLPKAEMQTVEQACQQHLARLIELMQPRYLIGVGAYAEKKLAETMALHDPGSEETEYHIGKILHPSPASPAANRGWAPQAEKQLQAMGVW